MLLLAIALAESLKMHISFFFTILVGLFLILISDPVSCNNAERFTEEPGPGPVIQPIGTQVQLNCSVNQNFRIAWNIELPGSNSLISTDSVGIENDLIMRGIRTQMPTEMTSILVINGTLENNQTILTCVAINATSSLNRFDSRSVMVTIYGPPSSPTNLETMDNTTGSIKISWDFEGIEGVQTEFNLTAINLNDSSTGPVIVSVQQQYYVFTVEDPSPCDVYSFQVTAVNSAGASEPSEIITRSFSLPPDIYPVEDSVYHSLVKSSEGIMLSVMFNVATLCPTIMINYTLVLEYYNGTRVDSSPVTLKNNEAFVEVLLMENFFYTYHILARNVFGKNESTRMKLFTTDVQEVKLCQVRSDIYSIQCSYINGSDAQGCTYTLVSNTTEIENITGIINRKNLEGKQVKISDKNSYVELLAYDLESDNTTDTLPIRGNINSGAVCSDTTSPVTESAATVPGLFTNIVVSIMVLLIITLVEV